MQSCENYLGKNAVRRLQYYSTWQSQALKRDFLGGIRRIERDMYYWAGNAVLCVG